MENAGSTPEDHQERSRRRSTAISGRRHDRGNAAQPGPSIRIPGRSRQSGNPSYFIDLAGKTIEVSEIEEKLAELLGDERVPEIKSSLPHGFSRPKKIVFPVCQSWDTDLLRVEAGVRWRFGRCLAPDKSAR